MARHPAPAPHDGRGAQRRLRRGVGAATTRSGCGRLRPGGATRCSTTTAVAGEVIFPDGDAVTGMEAPPFGAGLCAGDDHRSLAGWAGARAHNRWLEAFCATNPPRRAGVALVPGHPRDRRAAAGDRSRWPASPDQGDPHPDHVRHDQPSYGHPSYDPVWAACAEAGPPRAHTHSGEADMASYNEQHGPVHARGRVLDPPPAVAAAPRRQVRPVPEPASIAPGRVRVVVGRRPPVQDRRMFGGTNWKVKKMSAHTKGTIQRLPSEYFGTNVFIGALGHEQARDPAPLRQRPRRLMWGTDYPHPEGTWPNTGHPAHHRLPRRARRGDPPLLGLNAIHACYDLDLDALTDDRRRHRAPAERAPPGRRPCARRPTPSARPGSGSTTTASSGRADGRPAAPSSSPAPWPS